jgi:hypothetical protein
MVATKTTRARAAWNRRLRATFTERLELKVTAVVLAVVLAG